MTVKVVAGLAAALTLMVAAARADCLSFPLKGPKKATSTFRDPNHPYRAAYGEHNGIDLAAPQGTPIYASAGGRVFWAGPDGKTGAWTVAVRTDAGRIYELVHLSVIAVRKGERVRRGQFLGRTGGTPKTKGAGRFTMGPHLHFGLIDANNRFVDPELHFCR